jgi:tetratricopeptide (TPR) repeat protein
MVWLFGALSAGLVGFFFLNRPLRQWRGLSLAAMHARQRRDWATAGKFYGEALRAAGKLNQPLRSKLEGETEIEWACVLHRQGKLREAGERFRSGYSKVVEDNWRARLTVSQGYFYWGDLCTDEGRNAEAEQHYRQALKSNEAMGNLAGSIFALQRLADALIRQERRRDAEEAIQRAITLESQAVHEHLVKQGKNPAEDPVIPMSLPDLHFCRENYREARRLYREKVQFWERQVNRPDNVELGRLQMRLALAEAQTGHMADALGIYAEAASTFEREWGEEHPKAIAARQAAMSPKHATAAAG